MPLPKSNLFYGFAKKMTDEQKEYVNSILDNRVTFVNAISGSGKTTLAVACAKYLNRELLYVFSPCEEDKLGFTPGDVQDKESKYVVPLHDALLEIGEDPRRAIISDANLDNVKNGNAWVRAMSHVFARGTNIKGDKLLIIDEAQNFTRGELKKILTRVHDSVKVVVIGHDGQCDLKDPKKSGFIPYLEHYRDQPYAQICELTRNFRGEIATHADKLSW